MGRDVRCSSCFSPVDEYDELECCCCERIFHYWCPMTLNESSRLAFLNAKINSDCVDSMDEFMLDDDEIEYFIDDIQCESILAQLQEPTTEKITELLKQIKENKNNIRTVSKYIAQFFLDDCDGVFKFKCNMCIKGIVVEY